VFPSGQLAMKPWLRSGLVRTRRFLRFFRHINARVLWEVLHRSGRHRLLGLSAEIAYNAIFALFPALLAVISAIGLLALPESNFRPLITRISEVVPDEAMGLIQAFLQTLRTSQNQGLFSLSFGAAIWVSSNVLGSSMAALDKIHQIPPAQVRPFWLAKLVALGLSLGTFLLLLIALMVVVMSDVMVHKVAHRSGTMAHILFQFWHLLSLPIALGILAIALGFIYRYGTSRRHRGTPIMPGAVVASVLWVLLSGVLRLYIAYFGNYNQAYGAIGAVIILLLWLYLSAFSMLLGSQLNVVVGEAIERSVKISVP
jgi:membrane protein